MSEKPAQNSRVQELRPKEKPVLKAPDKPQISWREAVRRKPGEEMLKNLAVAASLVLCAAVLRSGAIPPLNSASDVVMTAVTGDTLLDDQLGKLSFVSAMFPETTLVFGEQSDDILSMPVSATAVVHAWSEAEPYMAWYASSDAVTASVAGEVVGVYHGNGEEQIVEVMSSDSLTCLYGNLAQCSVQVGDAVETGDILGRLMPGAECVLEVRRDGYSIDPAHLMDNAS